MLAKGVYKYRKLSLIQQYSNLQYCPLSNNGSGKLDNKYFYWEFEVTPTPLSKTYRVLIIYHIDNSSPDVYILDENIWNISKNRPIPHLYDYKKIRLCLYYPSYNEWNTTMQLCNTIVSWTYLWLYFYEEWLLSNNWKGGGKHPESETKNIDESNVSFKKSIQNTRRKKKKDVVSSLINKIYENRKKIYLEEMENK